MGETRSPVVILDPAASVEERAELLALAAEIHPAASMATGDAWAAIAIGDASRPVEVGRFEQMASVDRIVEVSAPYRLASREVFDADTSVLVGREPRGDPSTAGPEIGGRAPIAMMVGCAAPSLSEDRLRTVAGLIRDAGGSVLFAGEVASVSGIDDPSVTGLADMARIRAIAEEADLAVCVEVSDYRQIADVSEVADLLQVGSRNMQDFNLLRELGRADRPVLLKRGLGATVEEFLLAAEYVLSHGNGRVILCESGIRTFDAVGKPRFEINAIPVIKRSTHLPLMADPSQATPHARLVSAVARAAIAAGADGLVLEVTDEEIDPSEGAVGMSTFRKLMTDLVPIAQAVGRRM